MNLVKSDPIDESLKELGRRFLTISAVFFLSLFTPIWAFILIRPLSYVLPREVWRELWILFWVWPQAAIRPMWVGEVGQRLEEMELVSSNWIFLTVSLWIAIGALYSWITRNIRRLYVGLGVVPLAVTLTATAHVMLRVLGISFQYDIL